jgi:hypothetical protein
MARVDFFISYTRADLPWAEWIAWQLESGGYTTVVQAWDFRPGENFVIRMRDAIDTADRTLAVASKSYFASSYASDEWTGAFLHDPQGRDRLLIVRVDDVELPRLLTTVIYLDLSGLDQTKAKARLLAAVQRSRAKPTHEPSFPGVIGTPTEQARRAPEDEDPFTFHVFICHNSADKIAARELALALKQQGIRPWLDQWEIAPGTDWQGALEEQMLTIKSAAVLVGSSGMGPWQDLEKKAFLQQFLNRRSPVIPVILSDYKGELELPPFLSMLQFVDFRETDPNPLEYLIWGITGKRPE